MLRGRLFVSSRTEIAVSEGRRLLKGVDFRLSSVPGVELLDRSVSSMSADGVCFRNLVTRLAAGLRGGALLLRSS